MWYCCGLVLLLRQEWGIVVRWFSHWVFIEVQLFLNGEGRGGVPVSGGVSRGYKSYIALICNYPMSNEGSWQHILMT